MAATAAAAAAPADVAPAVADVVSGKSARQQLSVVVVAVGTLVVSGRFSPLISSDAAVACCCCSGLTTLDDKLDV